MSWDLLEVFIVTDNNWVMGLPHGCENAKHVVCLQALDGLRLVFRFDVSFDCEIPEGLAAPTVALVVGVDFLAKVRIRRERYDDLVLLCRQNIDVAGHELVHEVLGVVLVGVQRVQAVTPIDLPLRGARHTVEQEIPVDQDRPELLHL